VMTSRDLSTVVLLYGPSTEVLPVVMFQDITEGRIPEAAALGVILIAALLVLSAVAMKVARRFGLRLI